MRHDAPLQANPDVIEPGGTLIPAKEALLKQPQQLRRAIDHEGAFPKEQVEADHEERNRNDEHRPGRSVRFDHRPNNADAERDDRADEEEQRPAESALDIENAVLLHDSSHVA